MPIEKGSLKPELIKTSSNVIFAELRRITDAGDQD